MYDATKSVTVMPTYIGICGSDLQKLDAGIDLSVLGHEIVGTITTEQGERRVAVNPLISCGVCAYCSSDRSMFCRSLRVIGRDQPGGFSGSIEVPEKNIIVLSDLLSDTVATLADPYAVVWHGVSLQPNLAAAKNILIVGDGVVALLNLFYLLLHGTKDAEYTLIAKHKERAEAMTVWLSGIFDEATRARVHFVDQLGEADLFDVAIEAVGRDQTETFTLSVNHLVPRGMLLSYGVYPPDTIQPIVLRTVMYKEIIIQGVNSYGHDSLFAAVEDLTQHHALFENIVGDVFTYSNRDEAIAASRDKMKPVAKKIIIKMEQS